ncbi:HTH-type transcriptional regulator TtgR [Nocardia cerradoensis]|uniref:HTH-type transcriptional regulator TtgR n=1 Tax=Nocardia cerradoensis TaxID=85688 RepID=A0A231GU77_9NOCA|nr:TetR family transcriptional regulator [Nocardia cerradoensis]OXR40166.1 HTH-type transcriptional regulator TtgR [Nocardia cerradoensis]
MAARTNKSVTQRAAGSGGAAAARTRRTQQERTAQAEQALLDAAESLFAQRGVDQTSLGDVGQLAGYSRGLVNHHFGSRATLVDELARRIQSQFVSDTESAMNVADTGIDAVEVLANLVQAYLAAIARHEQTSRAFFVMWGASIPSEATLRPVFATDDAHFRQGVEAILRAGQDNGSVDAAVDPAATAVTVIGMLRGIAAQYLITPDAIDLRAATHAAQRFLRQTLAPARS